MPELDLQLSRVLTQESGFPAPKKPHVGEANAHDETGNTR